MTAGIARLRLESIGDDTVVLSVPGTEYKLELVPTVEPGAIGVEPGKRISGIINARALRMHAAGGGGRFIEPIYGAPRIVAGTVLAIDEVEERMLVDVSVPMWVSFHETQPAERPEVGQLVNFYVESGAEFSPT